PWADGAGDRILSEISPGILTRGACVFGEAALARVGGTPMKPGAWSQRIGIGLMVAVFIYSLVLVGTRARRAADPDIITLRSAHWQLEGGLREAFDAVALRYMELNPQVRVEQIPIPERVYASWMRTQLVGQTAPDLIEFGQLSVDVMDELLARNFVPLTAEL